MLSWLALLFCRWWAPWRFDVLFVPAWWNELPSLFPAHSSYWLNSCVIIGLFIVLKSEVVLSIWELLTGICFPLISFALLRSMFMSWLIRSSKLCSDTNGSLDLLFLLYIYWELFLNLSLLNAMLCWSLLPGMLTSCSFWQFEYVPSAERSWTDSWLSFWNQSSLLILPCYCPWAWSLLTNSPCDVEFFEQTWLWSSEEHESDCGLPFLSFSLFLLIISSTSWLVPWESSTYRTSSFSPWAFMIYDLRTMFWMLLLFFIALFSNLVSILMAPFFGAGVISELDFGMNPDIGRCSEVALCTL